MMKQQMENEHIAMDVHAESFHQPQNPDIDYIYDKAGAKAEQMSKQPPAKTRFTPKDVRVAAANGNIELIKQYLEWKPEYKDRRDKKGWNPLHFAVSRGHEKVVDLLLRAGVDAESVTNDGVPVIDMAVDKWGADHVVTQLVMSARHRLKHPVEDAHAEEASQDAFRGEL